VVPGLKKSGKASGGKLGRACKYDVQPGTPRLGTSKEARLASAGPIAAGERMSCSGRLANLFLKFRLDAKLLEPREIVDEDLAFQMIHLVLDAEGKQFLGMQSERLSLDVESTHRYPFSTLDCVVYSGYRKTALLPVLSSLSRDNLGVYQDQELITSLGGIDDYHPLVYIHLRRGEAKARGCIHGFRHVPHQATDGLVNSSYRSGLRVEPWIGVSQDGQ